MPPIGTGEAVTIPPEDLPSRHPGEFLDEIVAVKAIIAALRGEDGRAPNREIALAVTKLEEAELWLSKAAGV